MRFQPAILLQHLILRSDLQGKLFQSNRQPAHQRVSRSAVHAVRNKRHSGTLLPRAIYLCLNKKQQCQLLHAVVSRGQGSRHSKDKCANDTSMNPFSNLSYEISLHLRQLITTLTEQDFQAGVQAINSLSRLVVIDIGATGRPLLPYYTVTSDQHSLLGITFSEYRAQCMKSSRG
jgi:hypothetical protein